MEHIESPDAQLETPVSNPAVDAQLHTTATQARTLLSSTQIDAAQGYGASYHPLTGDMLVGLRFDQTTGRFVKISTAVGFGETSVTTKRLDRIGDGADHALDELPLAHWKFDPRTGAPLKRAS